MNWAIIPVKPLRESKSRLAAVLSPDERADLTGFLLQRTLKILLQTPLIDRIMVVSRDPEALKLARQGGAVTLAEGDRPGLNVALLRAAYVAAAQRATSLLILPSDLPLLTVADVEMMLTGAIPANGLRPVNHYNNGNGFHNGNGRHNGFIHHNGHTPAPLLNGHHNGHSSESHHDRHLNGHNEQEDLPLSHYPKAMTICPDHHQDGTNALFIRPATDFNFYYGQGSFNLHLQEAARQKMFYRVVHAPGMKFDLDTERDWATYKSVFQKERASL